MAGYAALLCNRWRCSGMLVSDVDPCLTEILEFGDAGGRARPRSLAHSAQRACGCPEKGLSGEGEGREGESAGGLVRANLLEGVAWGTGVRVQQRGALTRFLSVKYVISKWISHQSQLYGCQFPFQLLMTLLPLDQRKALKTQSHVGVGEQCRCSLNSQDGQCLSQRITPIQEGPAS